MATAILNGAATLAIEVAWGADLAADPAGWTWTDITGDVRHEQGIRTKHGSGDEASVSQPASCSMTLDNTSGRYSLGGMSPSWPNVRRNTPVRVRVDGGGGYEVLFQGGATVWKPQWDTTGRDATVALTAHGTLRRLAQGTAPVVSSLRRAILDRSDVVGYWPCEDGADATEIRSGLPGHPPMYFTNATPAFGTSGRFACSAALPVLRTARLVGVLPAYTHTGEVMVRQLLDFPTSGLFDGGVILRIYMPTGTAAFWDISYYTGGGLRLQAYTAAFTEVEDSGTVGFDVDGRALRLQLELVQDGGDVDWRLATLGLGVSVGAVFVGTLPGHTIGRVDTIEPNPNLNLDQLGVGQYTVHDDITSLFDDRVEFNAFFGEVSADRIARLCVENGIAVTELAAPGTMNDQAADVVGAQRPKTLVELLRDTEAAGGGLITDGRGPGVVWMTRRRRYSEAAAATLTVDAAAGELTPPFAPVDDDQVQRNKVTATREGGGSATYEDVDGPTGTAAIGDYDEQITVVTAYDVALPQFAAWRVHLGRSTEYRYPVLQLDLARDPALIGDWLAVTSGSRIDVVGADSVRLLPSPTVALIVEGYEQTISKLRWDVTVACSPAEVRLVAELDDSALPLRLDPTSSTLAASASVGATSLSVATSGPLWTTSGAHVPMTIDVAGIAVTVTAISGAGSPQTFTVTGSTVTKALPAGSVVVPAASPVLAI